MAADRAGRLPPLSLYLHWPWCLQRCGYCDFNAHALRGAEPPEAQYAAAVRRELRRWSPSLGARPVETIYIGGGTPSLLSPGVVADLLAAVDVELGVRVDAEITLEANPGAGDAARFAAFRKAGVNRLSLGVQSLDDGLLRRLGRVHDAAQAHRALEAALGAGFSSVNADLMYGLPGQSILQAEADARALATSGVPHVSAYQLTIEPETPLGQRPPPDLPGEEALLALEAACHARLADGGLERYEVSAFAAAGHRCRHNLAYWTFADYLGIGPGAASKLTDGAGGICRYRQEPDPQRWADVAGGDAAEIEARRLTREDAGFELMLNALRLPEGMPLDLAAVRAGWSVAALEAWLAPLQERGLVDLGEDRLRPTAQGLRMLDSVLLELLPEAPPG